MKKLCYILSLSCLLANTVAMADEFRTQYWKALNEGRDVSALAPILEQLAFPPRRREPVEELNRKALAELEKVARTEPLPEIVHVRTEGNVAAGGDWPTLGGLVTHTGETSEPGPVSGIEAWRQPVGWPWKAVPLVAGERVFMASPAIGTAMLCLDLTTGRRVWAAENPQLGSGRQSRAASPVIALSNKSLALYKGSFDGWALGYLVVDRDSGRVLRRVPATAQEKVNAAPESEPKQLVAHRIERGTQVIVKSLLTGRTWWRFPTGYLADEPLIAWAHVYAAAEDGTLWALNLWGDQRVAWTHKNPVGWGAVPTERDGTLVVGGNDGAVYAFQAKSGQVLWRSEVARPDPRSRKLFTPAVITEDRVYVGGTDGQLYAMNSATGKLLWKHDCGDWIRSRPFVAGRRVCVATLDGTLVAIDDEGAQAREAWASRLGRFPIYGDLAGSDKVVLASTSDFDLIALDMESGRQLWRESLVACKRDGEVKSCADSMPDIMQAPVTVHDGRVYFTGRTGFVIAADATTGERLWRFESGGRVSGSPTVCGGLVFVAQVGGNRRFYAVDAKTGQPRWSRALGEVWAPPECDDRQLFVGNKRDTLYCLDPANGTVLWQRAFAAGVYPTPTLDADTVYTGSWDGHYYALDRKNGDIRWAFSRPGRPYHMGGRPDSAAPVLAGDIVLVPSLGGRLVALDARTGKLVWEWRAPPWRICNVTAATDGRTVLTSYFGNAYEFPFDVQLVGLNIEDGQQLWSVPGPGGLTAPVITAGNRFIVGSMGSPFIYGYRMGDQTTDTPKLLWRLKTGGVMYESLPAVSGGLGYFLSNDGWLRAIR